MCAYVCLYWLLFLNDDFFPLFFLTRVVNLGLVLSASSTVPAFLQDIMFCC
uniref:Uncharacterized protein n=1 Tax=Anguilla anguilla TaxID=7936 RepID=A0A0E9U012_ANGAN